MNINIRLSTRYLGFQLFTFFFNWTGWDSIGFSFPFWLLYILLREIEKSANAHCFIFKKTTLKDNLMLLAWLLFNIIYAIAYSDEQRALLQGAYYTVGVFFFLYIVDAGLSKDELNWLLGQYIMMALAASLLLFFQRAHVPTYTNRLSVSILGHIKDPNYFSAYIMCPYIICFYRFMYGRKLSWLILSVIIGIAILLTGSRSSFLALMLGTFVVMMGAFKYGISYSKFVFITSIILFVSIYMLPDNLMQRLTDFRSYSDGSNNLRMNIWLAALNIWKEHMFLGAGQNVVANYGVEYGALISMMTHSTYLDVLAEFGFIGLLLFLYVPVISLYNTIKYKVITPCAILLSTLFTAAIISAQYSQYYWLNMALLCSMINIKRYKKRGEIFCEAKVI